MKSAIPKQKIILVADIAGRVEAVGSSVTQFHPVDEVFGDIWLNGLGGFAEYGCTLEDTLVLKPTRSIGADHVIDYTQEDFTQNGQRYDGILKKDTPEEK